MSASSKKKLRKEQAAAALTEKQLQEQKEAKKLKAISTIFIAVMLVVVLAAASILIIRAVNNSGVIDKNTVAATVDGQELDSLQVNYYLVDYIKDFYAQSYQAYGDSTGLYLLTSGLNISKPLNEQKYNIETGETWADYFLTEAMARARNDYALYNKAMEENYTLTDSNKAVAQYNLDEMAYYASLYGFKNTDAYLKATYGNGADLESYSKYNDIVVTSTAYYNAHSAELSYDNEAIREYEKKNYANFSAYSYSSYYINALNFIKGGTVGSDGITTYSEAEKETARATAEAAAKKLLAAKNVEELNKAIAALDFNSENPNAASTTYENTLTGSIPTVLIDWLSDDARVANDITMIANELSDIDDEGNETKSVGGYYVVLFSGRDDNLRPLANVRHILVKFEGGVTNATSGEVTYTDEEKAKAKADAELILDTWMNGEKTEESFIALVKKHSDDGSASTGGLFEDIHRNSNYVPTFQNWAIDPERKAGDTEVIESEFGYHVMYYVGDDELTYRDYLITEAIRTEDQQAWFEEVIEGVESKVTDTKRLYMDFVIASIAF